MELSLTALALVGVLLAVWTTAAAWAMVWAFDKARRAEGSRKAARTMARMIEEAPAIPMLVRADGRIEVSDRLAAWLDLDKPPQFLSELAGGPGKGLTEVQLRELSEQVRTTQKTAAPFRMVATQPGAQRSLAFRGALADPEYSPGGAALVWVFDFSE
ncbi:MAG: histidine kinase, partial [Sphingomonadaceae bacterium]|nr:histidine kinase [Sphingomonadaceae bacterium]